MKLLVIDDHAIVLEGLAALLGSLGADAVVVTARDAREGLALLDHHPDIDIVVLDLTLPGLSGHAAIREFGRQRPALPIVVLSSSEEPADVQRAFASGALGYVPKSATQKTLLSAVRLVLNGELYVPPLVMGAVDAVGDSERSPAAARLTQRQIEVLALLGQGQPNKAIAARLNLSEKTVKIHISAIFKALNVVNRTQAAAAGRAAGLI